MTLNSQVPEEISSFCERCSEGLSGMTDDESRTEHVSSELPSLLHNKSLFSRILCGLVEGASYPDVRKAMMFDNELLLWADPNHLFSLRLFFWGSGEYTQVHDHGSWGVIGPVCGELEVINYRREDDGTDERHAQLTEVERLRLVPGETTYTLPLNDGIHKIGNPTGETMVSLSLYGSPLARGYINEFDPATGSVSRVVAPKIKKKLLAMEALPHLDASLGRNALTQACGHPLEIIRTTCHASLDKLGH